MPVSPAHPLDRKQKAARLLAAVGAGLALSGTLYLTVLPKSYEASTLISIVPDSALQAEHVREIRNPAQELAAVCRVILSDTNLEQVRQRLGTHRPPVQINAGPGQSTPAQELAVLRSLCTARPLPDTRLILITVTGEQPEPPAAIANELVRVYDEFRAQLTATAAAERLLAAQKELAEVSQKLQEKRGEVNQAFVELNSPDATNGLQLYDAEQLAVVRSNRDSLRVEVQSQGQLLASLQPADADGRRQLFRDSRDVTNEVLRRALNDLDLATNRLVTARAVHGTDSPEAGLAAKRVAELGKLADRATDTAMVELEAEITIRKAALAALDKSLAHATTNLASFLAQRPGLPEAQRELNDLIAKNDAVEQRILTNDSKSAIGSGALAVEIVDPAEPPSAPHSPDKRIGLGIILAGLITAALGGLIHWLPDRRKLRV